MTTVKSKVGRKYPVRPDRKDPRDFKLKMLGLPKLGLQGANLMQWFPVPYDQGAEGVCTGFGDKKFREYFLRRYTPQAFVELSAQFDYWQERSQEGNILVDSGAAISDGMMAMQKIGICPETMDPYIAGNFANVPTQEMVNAAAQYKIDNYYRVDSLSSIKNALENGLPVVCGVDVYESFESDMASKTGIIPMPAPGEGYLGGHCLILGAFQDTSSGVLGIGVDGYVLGSNHWGSDWGMNGNFKMSYAVLNKLLNDAWTGTVKS